VWYGKSRLEDEAVSSLIDAILPELTHLHHLGSCGFQGRITVPLGPEA